MHLLVADTVGAPSRRGHLARASMVVGLALLLCAASARAQLLLRPALDVGVQAGTVTGGNDRFMTNEVVGLAAGLSVEAGRPAGALALVVGGFLDKNENRIFGEKAILIYNARGDIVRRAPDLGGYGALIGLRYRPTPKFAWGLLAGVGRFKVPQVAGSAAGYAFKGDLDVQTFASHVSLLFRGSYTRVPALAGDSFTLTTGQLGLRVR